LKMEICSVSKILVTWAPRIAKTLSSRLTSCFLIDQINALCLIRLLDLPAAREEISEEIK
jgi:hypothetical protein